MRLVAVVSSALKTKLAAFVDRNVGVPILCSYSSDTATHRSRRRHVVKLGPGRYRHRRPEKASEYLVQRAFYRSATGDLMAFFPEAAPMINKKAATVHGAFVHTIKPVYFQGHSCVSIHHNVSDKEGLKAGARLHGKQHQMNLATHMKQLLRRSPWFADLIWVASASCALRDFQGAFSNSLTHFGVFKVELVTKHAWCVVETLLLGFSDMNEHLADFIREKIHFRGLSRGEVDAMVEVFWVLEAPVETFDLIEDLELRWEDHRLCGSTRHRHNDNLTDLISQLYSLIWDFRSFTTSRWLSLGPCARKVLERRWFPVLLGWP